MGSSTRNSLHRGAWTLVLVILLDLLLLHVLLHHHLVYQHLIANATGCVAEVGVRSYLSAAALGFLVSLLGNGAVKTATD